MHGAGGRGASIALSAVVAVAGFVASWEVISALTHQPGLGLVWGIFAGLAAFQISHVSFRAGIALSLGSLFVMLLYGLFSMF